MTRYCFDLDGTLCTQEGLNYEGAEPIASRIETVNALFDSGHEVTIFTARGSGTGIDYEELTTVQLAKWGVKFHKLIFGKPAADSYIDDKAIHSDTFFWDLGSEGLL